MNARKVPVYLLALLLGGGCMRNSSTLLRETLHAKARAERAYEKHDVAAADLAAAHAEETLGELKLRNDSNPELIAQANAAALGARNFAQLAHEERQIR